MAPLLPPLFASVDIVSNSGIACCGRDTRRVRICLRTWPRLPPCALWARSSRSSSPRTALTPRRPRGRAGRCTPPAALSPPCGLQRRRRAGARQEGRLPRALRQARRLPGERKVGHARAMRKTGCRCASASAPTPRARRPTPTTSTPTSSSQATSERHPVRAHGSTHKWTSCREKRAAYRVRFGKRAAYRVRFG